MASTENQTTQSTTAFSTIMTNNTLQPRSQVPGEAENHYHGVLLAIYSVVLICGTISLSLMLHVLRSSSISTTSVAVLNLIFAHFIFLVTVPFRIYYYATNQWPLGKEWCKMVSSMIHIHMFMSFILYVIIIITRLLTFYKKATHMASSHRMYAAFISVLVWISVLVSVPCVVHFSYGKEMEENNTRACFKFGDSIKSAKEVNYISSTVIIVVAIILPSLQANTLRVLYRKHGERCTFQQEYWAELKTMFFALIMLVCFVPYHIFRLYYLENIHLQNVNEVFLSMTTFNCLDMLTFLGKRTCNICLSCRT